MEPQTDTQARLDELTALTKQNAEAIQSLSESTKILVEWSDNIVGFGSVARAFGVIILWVAAVGGGAAVIVTAIKHWIVS